MLYGDVLRYPLSEDTSDAYRFMFLVQRNDYGIDTILLRIHPEDDLWVVGDLVAAGINELEIAPE